MIKETPKILTSLQNPLVKHWVKLRENKTYRQTQKTALISGKKLVEEIGKIFPLLSLIILVDTPLPSVFKKSTVYRVTEEILKKVTGLAQPEAIAAEVPLPSLQHLKGKNKIVALDQISDPGNLGTLVRSALALGWEGVFLLPGCVDPFNEKAIRASKGGVFSLPMQTGSWEELEKLIHSNKLRPYVADIEGIPFFTLTYPKKLLLVLGNEAHGPSLKGKQAGEKITIPMKEKMESLNVAVAGGILMHYLSL